MLVELHCGNCDGGTVLVICVGGTVLVICVGGTMLVGLYRWNGFVEKVFVERCLWNSVGATGRVLVEGCWRKGVVGKVLL